MKICIAIVLTVLLAKAKGQTYLIADGTTDTYNLIDSVMGEYATGEMPDCAHSSFGHHIFQGNDGQLNREVFFFHAHVNEDNDRCQNFDRQRTEIRPDQGSLTGGNGDTVSHSWNFKLDANFQASTAFTHIHQLKAVGGDDSMPLITFTPRYKSSSSSDLELIHVGSNGVTTKLKTTNLDPFRGAWVHVTQTSTYGSNGKYSVNMSLLSNGQSLLSYTSNNIDMWRDGADYIRPKWGIYRSLDNKSQLRDEIVRFDTFCIGKGSQTCK